MLEAAIAFVESTNRPNAIGDDGRAVGLLQIHKIVVDDVNRAAGRRRFSYEDRRDPEKSKLIFAAYCAMYAHLRPKNMSREEFAARLWRRGPGKFRDQHGTIYWNKVRRALVRVSS